MNPVQDIKKIFKGEIFADEATLDTYSRDASLLTVKPKIVLFPQHREDVKSVVRYVAQNKKHDSTLSVTTRAAGSCMSGGSLNESIILDVTKHMNVLRQLTDEFAVVEPGMFYRDFEVKTLEKGVVLPCYTASKNLCALGGMIGNNAGGEKTLRYGKMENFIKELKVIFADGNEYLVKPLSRTELQAKIAQGDFEGNIYKHVHELIERNKVEIMNAKPQVSKNSAGYYLWNVWDGDMFDLTKLIVGSQGTLGIITEAKVGLVPVKKHTKLHVVFLKDLTHLAEIVNEILPFKPETIESYDDHTLMLAIKFLPGIMRSLKIKNFIKFAVSFLPETLMVLTGGMPKLVLLSEFSGNSLEEIDATMKEVDDHLRTFGVKTRITTSEAEAEKYWTIRRESFNLLRKHTKGRRTAPFIDDIIVRPEFLPEFMPRLTKILNDYELTYTVAGHAGDGNFHIIPLMNMEEKRNHDLIREVSDLVYDLVLEYKGSITAEHNDGIIRTPYLPKMFGDTIYDLFKQTKAIFDPQNIFNPGKKVGDTVEYMDSHIAYKN